MEDEDKYKWDLHPPSICKRIWGEPCFYTHINEGGVDVVGVLLSSFDWNDYSVELVY